MKKFRVLIADKSRLFAEALKSIVDREDDFVVALDAETGIEAVHAAEQSTPDIVIAGQLLPDMNMAQVIREMRRMSKATAFLFIVCQPSPELLRLLGETERIGAVPQRAGVEEFLTALRSVSRGERYVSKLILDEYNTAQIDTVSPDPLEGLTPREREVLYWIANGCSNSDISAKMVLSEKTVKNHVSHILAKLGAPDRTKAAAVAWKEGLPLIPEEFFTP